MNISDVKNWLFDCFIFLNNFGFGDNIVYSKFKFYGLIVLNFFTIFAIVVVAHGNVMFKGTKIKDFLFGIQISLTAYPFQLKLFVVYFKSFWRVNNIIFICGLYPNDIPFQ